MELQVLTATGARPEAWALCVRWMQLQDYQGPIHWVIVDDGAEPMGAPEMGRQWRVTYIESEKKWSPGFNTQHSNLSIGLQYVDRNLPLVIVEDDEHYKHGWLAACEKGLQRTELFGQGRCIKYNLAKRQYTDAFYFDHASLCCTAMRGAAIDEFQKQVRLKKRLIDVALWRRFKNYLITEEHHVTGIKRMPGRKGIDSGHRDNFRGNSDAFGRALIEFIGESAATEYLHYAC